MTPNKIALLVLIAVSAIFGGLILFARDKATPPSIEVTKAKTSVRIRFDSKDDEMLYRKWLKEGSLRELEP